MVRARAESRINQARVPRWERLGTDARRVLQLALAAIWLLDGLLQYQWFMYTEAFGQMIGGTAAENPGVIARPIRWNAALVEHHLVLPNTVFASIQLLLGLGIAYRPTVRVALAASIAWSLGVWWFGEGLGGVLSGSASPVSGGPGVAILYGLLAVLLWPAARPGMTGGEPGWISWLERYAATVLAHQGLAASIVLAAALIVIAVGVFLPPPLARSALILALVVAAFIWAFGEAFGQILAGGATDPNSAPLLALLALAYWPRATTGDNDGRAQVKFA
jgi:hypothetical protein